MTTLTKLARIIIIEIIREEKDCHKEQLKNIGIMEVQSRNAITDLHYM